VGGGWELFVAGQSLCSRFYAIFFIHGISQLYHIDILNMEMEFFSEASFGDTR